MFNCFSLTEIAPVWITQNEISSEGLNWNLKKFSEVHANATLNMKAKKTSVTIFITQNKIFDNKKQVNDTHKIKI